MKKVEKLALKELNQSELVTTEGGLIVLGIALVAIGIFETIENPGAFWDGLIGADL